MSEYGLSDYDATLLTGDKSLADLLEATARAGAPAKSAANWLTSEFLRLLNDRGQQPDQTALTPESLAELIALQEKGAINAPAAKKVFARLIDTGASPAAIVQELGLSQISDESALDRRGRRSHRRAPGRGRELPQRQRELHQVPRGPGDEEEQGARESATGE